MTISGRSVADVDRRPGRRGGGQGGVGKTTVTAVMARAAADADSACSSSSSTASRCSAELLPGHRGACRSRASDALDEYLRDHGFARVAKRLASSGVIDVVATAAPGIDDIVVLGKIKQLERVGRVRPDRGRRPGGRPRHHVPARRRRACSTRSAAGRCTRRPTDVLELLDDPTRCQVVLVTLPETTPVNEVIETAFALEDRVGVQLGPVVVNGVDVGRRVPDPTTIGLGSGRRRRRRCASRRHSAAPGGRCRHDEIARLGTRARFRSSQLVLAAGRRPRPPIDVGVAGGLLSPTAGAGREHARRPHSTASSVIVCCGSGGVGKTTTAAVIGLELARRGQRVVVVTIDPARRLADALGLPDGLGAEPQRIDLDSVRRAVGDDARHRGDVRRGRARQRRRRRAGRTDPDQPVLPQHRRRAQRHAGVHGGRDAARAPRRRALRPRRRRHAAEPQRARLPRGAGRARPVPRPPAVQADDAADARRACRC